jgi:hypothetical protein
MATMSDTPTLTISCDSCAMQASSHCDDCVVTFLCADDVDDHGHGHGHGVRQAVVLDLEELRAVRLLAQAGLVPTLRHREAI